jgi:hypothetical protein
MQGEVLRWQRLIDDLFSLARILMPFFVDF